MSDWTCDSCDREFGSWDGCRQHMNALSHWECDTCDKRFGSEHAVEKHMNALDHWDSEDDDDNDDDDDDDDDETSSGDSDYECDTCHKSFTLWDSCRQHMNALKHWRWPHECETCEDRFGSAHAAGQHMYALKHWSSYDHKCETCNLCFHTDADRLNHQNLQGHYDHLHCSSCDRYFRQAGDLDQHLNSPIHKRPDSVRKAPIPPAPPVVKPGPTLPVVISSPVSRPPPIINRTPTTPSTYQPPVTLPASTTVATRAPQIVKSACCNQLTQDNIATPFSRSEIKFQQTEPVNASQQEEPQSINCPFCRASFEKVSKVSQHFETSSCPMRPNLNPDNIYRSLREQDPDSIVTVQAYGPGAHLYHCPNTTGSCGGKFVSTLTALLAHLESESCGFMRGAELEKDIGDWSDIVF